MTTFEHSDIGDVIHFAKQWASLGDVIASQVESLVDDPGRADDVNPAAMRMAKDRLGGLNEGLDAVFAEYFEELSS